jgi:hypothetical protein
MNQEGLMMSSTSLGYDVFHQFTENEEAIDLRGEVLSTSMFEEIVGSSDLIRRVTAQVMRVAPSDATVLITGESGRGQRIDRAGGSQEVAQIPSCLYKDELRCHAIIADGGRAFRLREGCVHRRQSAARRPFRNCEPRHDVSR